MLWGEVMTKQTAQVNHILGKRWFESTNGNTYHTTTLFYGDGSQTTSPITYGYDDQYLQTAFEMMGLPYGGTLELRERKGITWNVVDVSRKKDL